MALFLLFSIPLFGLLLLNLRVPEFLYRSETWQAYFRGVASFMIGVLPFYIILHLYEVTYTSPRLYTRAFVVDFLVFLIVLALFFFLWEYRRYGNTYGRELFTRISAFVYGFFALTGVFAAYVHYPIFSAYRLFVFPLLIILVTCVTTVFFYLFVSTSSWPRFLYLFVPLAVAALAAIVPMLFTLSHVLLALTVCAFLFFPGILIFFLAHKGVLRLRNM